MPRQSAGATEPSARLLLIRILSQEADRQRDIAAARVASIITQASFLLIGAGLIAGSWTVDLIPREGDGAFTAVAFTAVASAILAAGTALIALVPLKIPLIEVDILVKQELAKDADPVTHEGLEGVEKKLLNLKSGFVHALNSDYLRRSWVTRVGYALLLVAIVFTTIALVLKAVN